MHNLIKCYFLRKYQNSSERSTYFALRKQHKSNQTFMSVSSNTMNCGRRRTFTCSKVSIRLVFIVGASVCVRYSNSWFSCKFKENLQWRMWDYFSKNLYKQYWTDIWLIGRRCTQINIKISSELRLSLNIICGYHTRVCTKKQYVPTHARPLIEIVKRSVSC